MSSCTIPLGSPIRKTQSIGFLLLNNFTQISLASAIEPLRMANQLTGSELYRWYTLTTDGEPVSASDGLTVIPDMSIHTPLCLDMVIVCGGVRPQCSVKHEHINWLKEQARLSRSLGAICTGSWALAMAGLLDGYDVSVHWEYEAAMREAFPRIEMSTRLFSIDRDRATCPGGTTPLDMILTLISQDYGHELSASISEIFICERVRSDRDQQRIPLRHTLGTNQPKLLEAVVLMEANLEEPIDLDELASYVRISRRQLERLFQKNLQCTPSRYYMKLRLTRARQLLKQTAMSIIEVASACGFNFTPHFSKCYRELFGISPRDERIAYFNPPLHLRKNDIKALFSKAAFEAVLNEPASSATAALVHARGESTYASVSVPPPADLLSI
ncbi:choline metabolism transcriptional regulator GbdR [Billgrantia sp. Q4P2]|uniref:choline metabolism transcriptional regulator GbdR n=1 Tax=Billgrantia sp. Q4P2 TaxID=3463857 RepID=UPI004057415C